MRTNIYIQPAYYERDNEITHSTHKKRQARVQFQKTCAPKLHHNWKNTMGVVFLCEHVRKDVFFGVHNCSPFYAAGRGLDEQ